MCGFLFLTSSPGKSKIGYFIKLIFSSHQQMGVKENMLIESVI